MQAGDLVGPYELVRKLGAGAFGEVWLATHLDLHAQFALKIPTDPQYTQTLRREGAVVFRLSHPNIVDVQHSDTRHDPPYLAMEYVEGEDLRKRLNRDGKLPVDEALGILRQLLDALQSAHDLGVLHRDLKPENLLLTPDGTVKITDFGIASVQAELTLTLLLSNTLMTSTGRSLSGTLEYMSPEQKTLNEPTPRDDIYSVGIVACELLTGRRPSATGVARLMERAGLSPEVVEIVERACEEPDERFRSAAEMLSAVDRLLAPEPDVPTLAVAEPRPEPDVAPPHARRPTRDRALEDQVCATISEQLGIPRADVTVNSSFMNDLGADSLDLVELVMELEEQLDITIPDEEAERLRTVGDVVRYIQTHRR